MVKFVRKDHLENSSSANNGARRVGVNVSGRTWTTLKQALDALATATGAGIGAATTAVMGLVRLSVAPADPAEPIAVGTNDPRMADARTPLPHGHAGLAPAGGSGGQVLKKNTGADWDYSWQADAVGGGGGGTAHTIQDEGSSLTARTRLNFVGAGVTVTDDSANDQTDVTIPGGGGQVVVGDVTLTPPSSGPEDRPLTELLRHLYTVEQFGARGKPNPVDVRVGVGTGTVNAGSLNELVITGGQTPASLGIQTGDGLLVQSVGTPSGADARNHVCRVTNVASDRVTISPAAAVAGTNRQVWFDDAHWISYSNQEQPGMVFGLLPSGSRGWNMGGDVSLAGDQSYASGHPLYDPRETVIKGLFGYRSRVRRVGTFNTGEARRMFRCITDTGRVAARDVWMDGMWIEGEKAYSGIANAWEMDHYGFLINPKSSDKQYDAKRVWVTDTVIRGFPGPITYLANCDGFYWRNVWGLDLGKGGIIFNANVRNGGAQDCFVLGSHDDAFAYNSDIGGTGRRAENVFCYGGLLQVAEHSRGGSCFAVRGSKGVRAKIPTVGGKEAAVLVQPSSDAAQLATPENVDIDFTSYRTSLPYYDPAPATNPPHNPRGFMPGGSGLSLRGRTWKDIVVKGVVREPGYHGVDIEKNPGSGEEAGYTEIDVRVEDAGLPRELTIVDSEVQGYTNGQTVVSYKGHDGSGGAANIDAQRGGRIGATGVSEISRINLENSAFLRSRREGLVFESTSRPLAIEFGRLLLEENNRAGAANLPQMLMNCAASYPRTLTGSVLEAVDFEATKNSLQGARLTGSPGGIAIGTVHALDAHTAEGEGSGNGLSMPNAVALVATIGARKTGGVLLQTVTTAYTAKVGDQFILADPTTAAFTIALPNANGRVGTFLRIKHVGTANAVTLDPASTQTIDGAATINLTTTDRVANLVCDGSNWRRF